MAVALSILDLAEGIGRRAVVVLVASGEEDKGALSEPAVESLSNALSVPVFSFSLGVAKSPAFPRGGSIDDLATLALAIQKAGEALENQRVVWLGGRYAPWEVEATAKAQAARISYREPPR